MIKVMENTYDAGVSVTTTNMETNSNVTLTYTDDTYAQQLTSGYVKTTGVKKDAGKPSITLIPSEYIEGTAAVFNFGAKKYGTHNYRMGLSHSRCLDAAFRHLLAINRGEVLDLESGLPHLYHASCSLAMLSYQQVHFPTMNDIFEQVKETK